jgi:hypothetical protein
MPTPVYIICCESGTEDTFTGAASLFNVVDRIMSKKPASAHADSKGPIYLNAVPLRIVAVWCAAEDVDFEGDFQSEVRMLLEPQEQVGILSIDTIRFTREKPRHRITVVLSGLKVEETGRLVIESRIKRAGEPEWLAQRYAIDVVVKLPDDALPAPVDEGTPEVPP